jgi:hypothetical protein
MRPSFEVRLQPEAAEQFQALDPEVLGRCWEGATRVPTELQLALGAERITV